jgi:acetoin utilization protein AcuB
VAEELASGKASAPDLHEDAAGGNLMQAAQAMTREVLAVPPELSLRVGWELMVDRRIRHLPVVTAGQLVGIVSDRDLLLRASWAGRRQVQLPEGTLAEVMTPHPWTASVATTVSSLARLMVSTKIDALPILDTGGKLVGLVTSSDLLELLISPNELKVLPFEFNLQTACAQGTVSASARR